MYKLFLCVSFIKYMIPAFLRNLFLSSHWVFYFPISSLSPLSLSFLSLWWLCSVHPLSFVSGSGNISQDVWLIHHLDNQKEKKPSFQLWTSIKSTKEKTPHLELPFLLFFSFHLRIWLDSLCSGKSPTEVIKGKSLSGLRGRIWNICEW